jgi:hypothetical protein
MSYRFVEVVVPEASHIRFRPSSDQLIAALSCLVEHGWCQKTPTDSLYVSVAGARDALRAAPEGVVHPYLQSFDAGSLPDWPEGEPEYTPNLCEDVRIVSSPVLLGLPADCMTGGQLLCPHCQEDMYSTLFEEQDARTFGDEDVPEFYEFVSQGFLLAPETCPACRRPLPHEEMVLRTMDIDIEAPFCYFALVLTALHTPSVASATVYLDPGFLEQLSEACGVPMRSTGHWR